MVNVEHQNWMNLSMNFSAMGRFVSMLESRIKMESLYQIGNIMYRDMLERVHASHMATHILYTNYKLTIWYHLSCEKYSMIRRLKPPTACTLP